MKIRFFLKSFDNHIINNATKDLKEFLKTINIESQGFVSLPIKIKKFCVLRSPHIDKDSREHFEIRLYKKFIDLDVNSSKIFDLLLTFKLPAGINSSIKIL